jgi:hypothetical protein
VLIGTAFQARLADNVMYKSAIQKLARDESNYCWADALSRAKARGNIDEDLQIMQLNNSCII